MKCEISILYPLNSGTEAVMSRIHHLCDCADSIGVSRFKEGVTSEEFSYCAGISFRSSSTLSFRSVISFRNAAFRTNSFLFVYLPLLIAPC